MKLRHADDGRPLGSRYVLVERIGQGSCGVVWLADDRHTGDQVAVKILRPELAGAPGMLARFVGEAELFGSVSHASVVAVRDVVVEGGALAVVMDLVRGPALRSILVAEAPLAASAVCSLGAQVAAGLAAVHAAGIVHADVKPENILVAGAVARLADFGLARFGGCRTGREVAGGTPDYRAPELRRGNPPSAAADVYALGLVLYEACTASLPRRGPVSRADHSRLAGACCEQPELAELVLASLAPDPRRRPAARTVAARLLALGGPAARCDAVAVRSAPGPGLLAMRSDPGSGPESAPAGRYGPLYEQYAGDRRPTVLYGTSPRSRSDTTLADRRSGHRRLRRGVLAAAALAVAVAVSFYVQATNSRAPNEASAWIVPEQVRVAQHDVVYHAPTGWLCGPPLLHERTGTQLRIQSCLLGDEDGTVVAVVRASLGQSAQNGRSDPGRLAIPAQLRIVTDHSSAELARSACVLTLTAASPTAACDPVRLTAGSASVVRATASIRLQSESDSSQLVSTPALVIR